MNRKMWGVGFCGVLILGLLGYGFLSRGGDRASRRVETGNAPEQAETASPPGSVETTPPATGPVVSVGEKKGASFQVRVLWLDTNQPVEGATVTLIPELKEKGAVVESADKPEPGNKPKNSDKAEITGTPKGESQSEEGDKSTHVLTGLTDKTGTLSLECPPDLATTGTLRCREIKAEYPGTLPVFRRGVTLTAPQREPLYLFLPKAYGYFGTVYRRDAAGNSVPAPGARVSAVSSNQPNSYEHPILPPPSVCDDQGHYEIFSLPDNVVYLWGQWEDQVTVEAKTPVMGKPGERSGPFDLYLEQGASLTALVSDKATLKPIPGATVEVKFARQLSRSVTADSEGFCEVKGLPLGRIEVVARAEGYADESSPMVVTPDSNSNTVPFFLDKGSRVRILTVQGKNKIPVPDVPLFLKGSEMVVESVSDSNGIALVEGLKPNIQWKIMAGGDYINAAWIDNSLRTNDGKTPGEFIPEVQKTVEMTLRVASAMPTFSRHETRYHDHVPIEGLVVNESGEPVQGAIVSVSTLCCHSEAVTDSLGEFHLENACIRIYPTSRDPLPDLRTVKSDESQDNRDIDLSKPENYLPRPNHINNSGASVSCYVGPVTLAIEAKGYVVAWETLPIDRKSRIVLKNKADAEARIRVLDSETKQPITDYWFEIFRLCKKTRVCSRDGILTLKELVPLKELDSEIPYKFIVRAEGYVEKTIEKMISRNSEENQIDILLERQKQLTGLIVDAETQKPLEGVEIRYTEMDIVEEEDDYSGLTAFPSAQTLFTDSRGEFLFTLTKPTGYLIFLPAQYAQFAIPPTELEQYRNSESGKIIIPLKKFNASVSGILLQGPESRLKQNWVRLNHAEGNIVSGGKISSPKFEDGSYLWEGISAGEYELSCGSALSRDSWIMRFYFKLSANENRTIRIEENCSACLSGRILGPGGAILPSVTLKIESESEENGERIQWTYLRTSDENGLYRFDQIAPGTYKVTEFESRRLLETIQVNGDTRKDLAVPK